MDQAVDDYQLIVNLRGARSLFIKGYQIYCVVPVYSFLALLESHLPSTTFCRLPELSNIFMAEPNFQFSCWMPSNVLDFALTWILWVSASRGFEVLFWLCETVQSWILDLNVLVRHRGSYMINPHHLCETSKIDCYYFKFCRPHTSSRPAWLLLEPELISIVSNG